MNPRGFSMRVTVTRMQKHRGFSLCPRSATVARSSESLSFHVRPTVGRMSGAS